MNKKQIKILEALKRVNMHVGIGPPANDIKMVITFIEGYDYAHDNTIFTFAGFREWLRQKYGIDNNDCVWAVLMYDLLEKEDNFDEKVKKLASILIDFFEQEEPKQKN